MATEKLTYSIGEVAAILGLSRNASYAAAKNGQIPCIKIGKRLLVPRVQLERLLRGEDTQKGNGSGDGS